MERILVIDDDEAIAILVKNILTKAGYQVDYYLNALDVDRNKYQDYSLILLDVMMPNIDGFTLCKQIRSEVDAPILFLTAKTREIDLLEGFGVGADDYITKPFRKKELLARVSAHLRRENREKKRTLFLGGVQFSLLDKTVSVNDREISLTKSEYAICELLSKNAGQVFSKDQIYDLTTDYLGDSDSSTVVEHIKNIRGKFKKENIDSIETVWGFGYQWKKDER